MKEAKVLKNGVFSGIIREDEEGFHFRYETTYLKLPDALPISPSMPLSYEEYEKETMFPVFDGLIPEGWLLDIASKS